MRASKRWAMVNFALLLGCSFPILVSSFKSTFKFSELIGVPRSGVLNQLIQSSEVGPLRPPFLPPLRVPVGLMDDPLLDPAESESEAAVEAGSARRRHSDAPDGRGRGRRQPSWYPRHFESEFGEHLHAETDSEDAIWDKVLPFEFQILRTYLILHPLSKLLYRRLMYTLASVLFVFSLLALFYLSEHDGGLKDFPLTFKIMFVIQAIFYTCLPFISFAFLDDVLNSSDVAILFSEALKVDSHFQLKFQIMTHFNFFLGFASIVSYAVFSQDHDEFTTGLAIFFSLLFVTPYIFAFCILLLMLEAYRLQSSTFIADLKLKRHHLFLDSANSVKESDLEAATPVPPTPPPHEEQWRDGDMIDRYYTLHARCVFTSTRRGRHILFLFLYSGISAIGSAYGALTRQYNFLSIFVFTLIAVLVELQIGCSLVTVNEMATQVCRELCTTQLCSLRHKTITSAEDNRAMNTFTNCIAFSKLEIYFFGSFALRSSTLLAVIGSILAAIIPSIILHTT
jgi:hypothetical protein